MRDAARSLGLRDWQFSRAQYAGLIEASDGEWIRSEAIDDARQRLPAIKEEVGTRPWIGARRSAEYINDILGIAATDEDVETLTEAGILCPAGEYMHYAMYDKRCLDFLCSTDAETICEIVSARELWLAESYSSFEARQIFHCTLEDFEQLMCSLGIGWGPGERYSRQQIDALASDADLRQTIRERQLLNSADAATFLKIRRRDFDHCIAAGWITPTKTQRIHLGHAHLVDAPLYRLSDLDAMLTIPGVDWEAVRRVPLSDPSSPLLAFVSNRQERETAVTAFAADVSACHNVDVATRFSSGSNEWLIRWTPRPDGPTQADIHRQAAADESVSTHLPYLRFQTGPIDSKGKGGPAPGWTSVHRAAPVARSGTSALQHPPEWENLFPKLAAKMSGKGAPGLSLPEAAALASKLRDCGVVPRHRGNQAAWVIAGPASGPDVTDTCGRLEDSVTHRFAPNLTRRALQHALAAIAVSQSAADGRETSGRRS